MQIAAWLWNWLDAKKPAGCFVPPFDYATKLSSLRLEDRRVLSVTPVLTGGVLDVSMTSGGDSAKISVVQDNQGVSSILVTDQLNNTTSFLASAVDSIEITGAAGAQSVVFEGSNLLDIGSLSINNSVDHVTIQSAVNVHSGPATIFASQDIQIEGAGRLTADDPNSSADALNITLSSGEDLTVQQLFASGKINLSAASSLTVTDGAATHDLQAGTGISASVTGNLGSFVIESSADVNSLSGGVSVTANRMDLAGTITAQGQSVSLAPNPVPLQLPPAVTTGRLIDLGTTLDGPNFLGLSATELSHIDAATLAIGNNQSGTIAITAAITFPTEIDLSLRTGNNQISFQGGSLDLQGGDLTLRTGNGGAVIADAAGLDVSADTVSIITGLGIGTSVNPLRMNASFLTTNTSATNAGQFLSEFDALTIASAGLNAGTGTINLVDGLFVSGGTDRIRDISSLVVGLDATFDLQGHAETLANLTNNGSLILGPALVDTGALSMTGDATLNVVINGSVPGISYSQIESSGPVTLGQATLNLSLGTSLIVGAQFTLLDNTGSAPIVGTFKNLAEGATFHDAATTFSISYVGGASGNDIVLTVIATPTNVFVDGMGNLVVADSIVGGNRDQLTIQSDVANAQYIIHDPVNLFITNIPGATISPDLHTIKVPFSAIPGTQVLVNTYGQDDSLTVDFSLGDFSRSVRYDGGAMSSTGDAFALIGGPRFSAVEHTLVDTVSGEVSVRGSKLMTYQSVEDSISDRLNAQNRTFSFAGGSANVALQVSGNFLKISSNQSASVTFVNPTSLLAINGSVGDDNITVFSVNPGFRASMTIDGGAGTDVVNLRTALVLGSATSAGDLNVTAETINLSADIRTNSGPTGGDVTLTGSTAIILESNITINTDVATGNDGQITFNSPVKGDQVPAARDLTLTAGSGSISMQNIGIGKALRKFTVTSAGQTSLQQVQTLAGGIDISSTELRLNDNLTTSGAILLDTAVRLQDSVTLKSTGNGDIHFKKTIDGAFDLAVETAGVTRFDGHAGSLSTLKSVTTDSPGSTTLAANMTTLDSISFNDSVRLTNNVILVSQAGATVAFAKQIDGAFHLAVNTTGTTSLGGVVGGATALSSLTTNSGGTTKINSDITTTGAIQFNDAIELTSNVTLASKAAGDIGFATTVNGPGALVVNTSGVTKFSGVVGGTTALASLKTDDAGTTYLNADLTVAGALLLQDAVILTGNATLKSTGGDQITFGKTVDGAHSLNVNTAGITRFNGKVGATTGLASVTTDAPGTTSINADLTTAGQMQFNDSVLLTNHVLFTSTNQGDIRFEKSLNGGYDVVVNTGGSTRFSSTVGDTETLLSLTTDSPGSTSIHGNISTVNNIQFNDTVTLTNDARLTSNSGGTIVFEKTVDGLHNLIIDTAGTTRFNDTVGGASPLASLTTNSAGSTRLNSNITTVGSIQFNDVVTITNDIVLNSQGGHTISFGQTVDGGHDLTVNTAGTTVFSGVVGGITALSSLTTESAGTTRLNGNITTTGAIQFNDAVAMLNSVVLTSSGGGTIRFGKTVDGAFGLTAVTSGVTRFNGNVGGTTALAFLTTDAPGETQLNANLKTTGNQTIRDELSLLKSVTMETTANGNILLESPVDTRGNDLILSAGGSGDVTVQDDISGGGHLTVKQGTDISFGPISVDSLTIEKATTSVTLIGAVITTGSVSVNSSGTIDQQSTVQSDAGIQYTATGVISIQNSMTAGSDIVIESKSASVKVSSTAPLDAGNDLRIGAGTTISSESTLTAGNAVDLNSVGTTTLSTAANIESGIGGVSIKASKLTTGASITTADGDVIINGPTQLTNHIEINTKSAGDITVTGSINGTSDLAQNLKLLAGAGNVKVTGDIGNSVRLGEVIIQSANNVDFDGSLSSLFFQQLQGTGVTTFHGAVNTFGTIGGTGDGFQFTGESLRFEPGSSSLDTHGKDVTLTADAITLPTTFVRATNSTVTIQTLSAATSIGLGDATQTLNFTDSQLDVIDSDNIVIGSVTQTAGIKIGTDGPITQSENYELKTAGNITVNGLFQLDTNHQLTANVGTDLQINASGKLATSSGRINLEVGRDTRILGRIETASGSITVDSIRNTSLGPAARIETASGDIEITTGATISGTGFLMMANGSLIDGGTGRVSMTAEQDVTLSQVKTTNGTDLAIRITSHSGGIRNGSLVADNLIDETNGARVTLRSATGIGSNSGLGIDSSVVTRVSSIDLLNTTSGDIRVHEKSGLLIHRIDQQGPGMIDVHVDGTSTVLATGSGIKAREGNVLLSADGPASDLLVRAPISTTGGDITLRAGHDVRIDATGPINSNNGDVQIIADSGLLKNGIGGQVLMQDGATIRAGTGTVLLQADQNLTVAQIETFNGSANALRLVSASGSLVNAGNSAGDNLIANANGALTTIQTRVGVGAIQPLNVDLDRLNLTNGTTLLPLPGIDTRIQLSERNSVVVERLVQHNGGNVGVVAQQNLTVGQISAIIGNSFISLESTSGAIVTGGSSVIHNVAARTLVMRALTGIGSESPLVTNVLNLAATNSGSGNLQVANVSAAVLIIGSIDGVEGISHTGSTLGSISVSNTAPIDVAHAVRNTSGGNVTLNATGPLSGITVTAPVLATGSNGNINLIAGFNINLFDTGLNADIRAEGTGVITIQSGNLVNFFPNVIVQSGTGSITNAPPRFVNLLTPQITAGGIATVTGDFGRPGEHNFTITVNWNDGTFTTEVFENPGSFIFTHFYNENPNPTNPAAPIPIDVTVVADLQIHVFGRNTTTNNALGSLDFTTLRSFAPVPGEGFGAFAFDLTPTVKLLHFPEPQPVGDLQQGSAQTPTVALVIEPIPEKDDLGPSAKRKVFFQIGKRNADGTGWEYDEGIELTEDFLEQIFDPELIEQIPDGRYRVQLQEPGETIKRLVIEFEIVNGTIADGTGPMREDLVPESLRTEKTTDPATSPPEGIPADALDPENEVPVQQQIDETQLVPPPVLKPQQTDLASEPQIRQFDSANSHMNKHYESFASNSGRRLWQKAVCELEQRDDSVDDSTVDRDAIPAQEPSEFGRTSEFTPLESSVVLVGLASTIAGVGRSTIPNHRAGARNAGPLPMSRAARLMRKFTTRREGAQ